MSLRVGLYTARYLGEAVANLVHASGVEVVARNHKATGWWGTAGTPRIDDAFSVETDLVISCLTDHIFTPREIARPRLGIINLHPALLPQLRGCNSYSHAILNRHEYYGVTLHHVDKGIDTGAIIKQRAFKIPVGATARQIHDHAQVVALETFAEAWRYLLNTGTLPPAIPQREADARYYPRSSLEPYRYLADHPTRDHARIRRALTFPPFPMPIEPQGEAR